MTHDALSVLATLPLRTRRAVLEQRLQDLADVVMRVGPQLAVSYAARAQSTEIALRVVEAQIARAKTTQIADLEAQALALDPTLCSPGDAARVLALQLDILRGWL